MGSFAYRLMVEGTLAIPFSRMLSIAMGCFLCGQSQWQAFGGVVERGSLRWEGSVQKGVRHLLPERPEGCYAQKVPDPFLIHASTQHVRLEVLMKPSVVFAAVVL